MNRPIYHLLSLVIAIGWLLGSGSSIRAEFVQTSPLPALSIADDGAVLLLLQSDRSLITQSQYTTGSEAAPNRPEESDPFDRARVLPTYFSEGNDTGMASPPPSDHGPTPPVALASPATPLMLQGNDRLDLPWDNHLPSPLALRLFRPPRT